VADGAYVNVGLGTREFFFSHFQTPKSNEFKLQKICPPAANIAMDQP
jgi:hypothetical protein